MHHRIASTRIIKIKRLQKLVITSAVRNKMLTSSLMQYAVIVEFKTLLIGYSTYCSEKIIAEKEKTMQQEILTPSEKWLLTIIRNKKRVRKV
jgi:hypothetical protein